jgi:hypothetical protein
VYPCDVCQTFRGYALGDSAGIRASAGDRFALEGAQRTAAAADNDLVSMIGICSFVGLFAGGYLPVLAWGASDFGFQSLLFGAAGGIAGVVVGHRLTT